MKSFYFLALAWKYFPFPKLLISTVVKMLLHIKDFISTGFASSLATKTNIRLHHFIWGPALLHFMKKPHQKYSYSLSDFITSESLSFIKTSFQSLSCEKIGIFVVALRQKEIKTPKKSLNKSEVLKLNFFVHSFIALTPIILTHSEWRGVCVQFYY